MLGLILTLLMSLSSHNLLASEWVGLTVSYAEKFSAEKLQELDQLHQKLGVRLSYRSRLQHRDDLVLKDEREFLQLDSEARLQLLNQLCSEYRRHPGIKKCQHNTALKIHQKRQCESNTSSALPTQELAAPLLALAETIASCAPFPDQSFHLASPTRSDRFGRLTRFWAQEAVGGPEVHHFFQEFENIRQAPPFELPPLAPASVGIIDGGFDPTSLPPLATSPELRQCLENWNATTQDCGIPVPGGRHGTAVSHLIAGAPPIGIGVKAELSVLSTADALSFTEASDRILSAHPVPAITNMSMGLPDGELVRESFERVSRETLLVASAGNSFPDPIDENLLHAESSGAILIGSCDPGGFPSQFSQQNSQVTICAPADVDIQQSLGPGGDEIQFGGTSGAAPEVTGALANVLALLPGLTAAEAKILLQQTAIETAATKISGNGQGSLNAYLLARVAHRLMTRWPGNRNLISNSMGTETRALFNFESEATRLTQEALPLLANLNSCEAKQLGLKKLRLAFFLNPKNKQIRQSLAQVYRELGFEEQARFYAPVNLTDPEILQRKRNRTLLTAIARGDLDAVRTAVESGADLQTWGGSDGSNRDNRPIQIAARLLRDPGKRREIISYLHAQGSRLHPAVSTMMGNPPQHPVTWAAQFGFPELVPAMLAQTPALARTEGILSSVSDKSQSSILRSLLENGANVEDPDNFSGMTPLMKAVLSGDPESVSVLLQFGADKNVFFESEGQRYSLQELASSLEDSAVGQEILRQLAANH
jgi:hypothetical protein